MSGDMGEERRRAMLEKKRAEDIAALRKQKEDIEKLTTVKIGADRFQAQNDSVENALKAATVGLVRLEDFQRIKSGLEEQAARERAFGPEGARKGGDTKKRKEREKGKVKLSFGEDEEEAEGENGAAEKEAEEVSTPTNGHANGRDGSAEPNGENGEDAPAFKKKKISKNPTVDTSFLPDREREEAEHRERQRLKEQWLLEQEKIKGETITITYSFWDGSGHRKTVDVKKGDTVSTFLEKVRQQWHELRGTNVDNMMFIKEDLIIPQHYTFYDFILNKTRGKSGPLFNFEVKDDVRLLNDASIEVEEAHAGKVVERAWYERNKHIFPASRWEVFDPEKDYGRYTIKDLTKGIN
ncbi:XAP5, circadian clock regulator-domain-containing protein [Hyaloraphidium curvatum]|nr:XAP5, circadian clock regulator-domain-containing protein [Hyaloraphidium curvatum]